MIHSIQELNEGDLKGKRVLLRADFNVPLGDDMTVDESVAWRIHKGLRTIKYLSDSGARVIIITHLGRDGETLKPVVDHINLHTQVGFVPELFGERVETFIRFRSFQYFWNSDLQAIRQFGNSEIGAF